MSKKNREINCEISTVVPELPKKQKDYFAFIRKVEATDFNAVYKAFAYNPSHCQQNLHMFCEIMIEAMCHHSRGKLSPSNFQFDGCDPSNHAIEIDPQGCNSESEGVVIRIDSAGSVFVRFGNKTRQYNELTFKYVATDIAKQFTKSMVKDFMYSDLYRAMHTVLIGINAGMHRRAAWKKDYADLFIKLQKTMMNK